ncbi:hypothetical protein [Sulfitobacter dubius]|uniref:hypothetical protein n=1 Tax=Sulfitobacter dubius TaxID=218673 RepID=UPI002943E60E|nr:hypothetical protein [Sulfitobacter dubius]WOI31281.1 hypothetical protein R1T39_18940 [Sulfitobacter dubius]
MLSFRVAVVGVFLAMIGPEGAFAHSLDRTVVRVHCAGGEISEAQRQQLCRNIVQSLVQIIPQSAPRMVPADQWQPGRPQDISVRLEICGTTGKLLWQKGPTGELHSGPGVPFDTTSGTQTSNMKNFANKLVAATRSVLARTLK